MRYLIDKEDVRKALFQHYPLQVLPKICLAWPWLPLKLPPAPCRSARRLVERTPLLTGLLLGCGSEELLLEMPLPSKANLLFAPSDQILTTWLLKQCQHYFTFCLTASSQKMRRRNSRLSAGTAFPFPWEHGSSYCSACWEESPCIKPRCHCCCKHKNLLSKGKQKVQLCHLPNEGYQGSWIRKTHPSTY